MTRTLVEKLNWIWDTEFRQCPFWKRIETVGTVQRRRRENFRFHFPDWKKIVVGQWAFVAGKREYQVRIFDVDSGRELQRFGNGFATCVLFSPDGKKIIARGLNRIGILDI